MRARPMLAAGALTAATTLALVGLHTPAQAAYHHHESGRPSSAAPGLDPAVTPDVTVTSHKSSIALSTSTITPGDTVFATAGRGGVEVVSLKGGYTTKDFLKDTAKLFQGDVATVRRVDDKVVFWGGAQGTSAEFGIDLPAGSYDVVNVDRHQVAPLTVAGTPSTRTLPATAGKISMVGAMTFHADATLPHRGWVSMRNRSSEPHFTDLSKVRSGTTAAQVRHYLMSGAQGQPSFGEKEFHEALVVSPGHTFTYFVDATRGEYVELCFWPSRKTGMPHSLMGMFDISRLT